MAVLISTRLTTYDEDGDTADESGDYPVLTLTMLDNFHWPYRSVNLLKYELPIGETTHTVNLEILQMQTAIDAMMQSLTRVDAWVRIDAWAPTGGYNNGPHAISGTGQDVTFQTISLPKRLASEGVTARPALTLVSIAVPNGEGGSVGVNVEIEELRAAISTLQLQSPN